MSAARVARVAGALEEASPAPCATIGEQVRLGPRRLLGEVIRIDGDRVTAQAFEDTTGLALGDPVVLDAHPMLAELGPGLLGSVLDGTGRPLAALAREGDFIAAGTAAPMLDRDAVWEFMPQAASGTRVGPGDVIGVVEERPGFEHRIMVPPGMSGRVDSVASGRLRVREPAITLEDGRTIRLAQDWPIRRPRPVRAWRRAERPFLTGQRVFDLLFPVAQGGTVALPGGFGTGKTVIEQSLAKYGDADVVVYVGCGERGNEMADLLETFPGLQDPVTGRSLMDRTVMIVNTSNMPVAAREASVYLGLTVAEYWRDQGYRVAVLTDSLSRWAEALREIGSLLREMPGEEGYPTSLGNRLGKLFERAGRAAVLGAPERVGSVTLIAALSPPGGDFAEPVTQAALRVAGALWALDPGLAHRRQFPAVDWESSYSLQADEVVPWFDAQTDGTWGGLRAATLELLQRDRDLREVAGLVGPEALEDVDRVLLAAAVMLREIVLSQSAFDPNDAASPVAKSHALVRRIHQFHHAAAAAVRAGVPYGSVPVAAIGRALATARDVATEAFPAALERVADLLASLGPTDPEAAR